MTLKDRAIKIAEEEICDDVGMKATLKILKAIERAIVEEERPVTSSDFKIDFDIKNLDINNL
jgi:hypothetical protein|tara:strand:- start:885 stop:1070 length:186 start_codon:yes stop_codon:yes gene_type:complete